jgi:transposase InsO family protein
LEESVAADLAVRSSEDESAIPGELIACEASVQEEELEMKQAFEAMLQRARDAGLPEEEARRLQDELAELDVWRTRLGNDPPAAIPAFEVKLKPGIQPFRAKARRYSQEQSQAIAKEVADMEKAGLLRRNWAATWANPVMALPKPHGRGWRLVVDLVQTNRRCEPRANTLPLMESQWEMLAGATCFASIDLHKGFWQIALAENSQEYFTIITDKGCYTPTRLMMGATDASHHFQAGVAEVLGGLLGTGGALLWIDDILVHATDERQLVDRLSQVFKRLNQAGLKADPRKCQLYAREIRWFGRLISADGIRADPDKVQALRSMSKPTCVCELQQFLGATGWMRNSIPEYASVVAPLQQVLQEGLRKTPKTKGKSWLQLSEAGWGREQDEAFDRVLEALKNAVALAVPDPEKQLALFTDASDKFWSAVVVQYAVSEKEKPVEERDMQPLAFLSGAFVGAASRWTICDKEAYPIVAAVNRLEYLLQRTRPFTILTDHRNLIYIMSPERSPHAKRATIDRVHRWALQLRPFNYVIEHVDGEKNLWADLLSRWARAAELDARQGRIVSVSAVCTDDITGYLAALEDTDRGWPDLDEIRREQRDARRANGEEQSRAKLQWDAQRRLWVNINGRVWIPTKELQLRVMVVAHAGMAGHRGVKVTTDDIARWCWWPGLRGDARAFVQGCLQCRNNKGPRVIPRPLGETLRGVERNEVLHMDYLFMGPGMEENRYLLVLKDGFTGYTELISCRSPTALVAAQALTAWCARFGAPKTLVSDRASHFMNEMLSEVTRRLGIGHHFTVAYSPWANGTVERINRDILALARIKLAEARLPAKLWPQLVPAIAHTINNYPSDRRGGVAPVTAFCGFERSDPIRTLMEVRGDRSSGGDQHDVMVTVHALPEEESNKVVTATEKLVRSLQQMHMRIHNAREREREAKLKRTDPTARQHPNFDVGDYVLYTVVSKERGKLQARKMGPARISAVKSEWVYEVEDLITGQTEEMHASRLEFYADRRLHISEELKEQLRYGSRAYEVDKILEVRRAGAGGWQGLVKWAGFSRDEATWEHLEMLCEDVPELVEQLLDKRDIPEGCRRFIERQLSARQQ